MVSLSLNYHDTDVDFFKNLWKLHPKGKYKMSESGDTKWFSIEVNTESVKGKEDIVEYDFAWFLSSSSHIPNTEFQEMMKEQEVWAGREGVEEEWLQKY